MQLITKKPTAQFVTMTQQIVDDLLNLNTKNRNQRSQVVNLYRRAIESNLWLPTNQGIGVAASGFLVDGQHRLEALKAAGYPHVVMLVVTGLPDAAMGAVDGGANRTARDYLQFMFETKVSTLVSAILRTSMMACDGFDTKCKYPPQEYAVHFELLGDSIADLLKVPGIDRLPAAVLAALVDAYHKGYQTETVEFATAVTTGEMLERNSPALVLRNWLSSTRGAGGHAILVERYGKATSALQAWIDQRPLSKLYRPRSQLVVVKPKRRA